MKNNTDLIKIYLDTSVYGVFGNSKSALKTISVDIINLIDGKKGVKLYYSSVLEKELENAPKKVKKLFSKIKTFTNSKLLMSNNKVEDLSKLYIQKGILAVKSYEDARHIAYASYYSIDILITSNMKHMVNFVLQEQYNDINLLENYSYIKIRGLKSVLKLLKELTS